MNTNTKVFRTASLEPVSINDYSILDGSCDGNFRYHLPYDRTVDVVHITVTIVGADASSTNNVFKNINDTFEGVRFDDMVRFLRLHAVRSAEAWSDFKEAHRITPDDPSNDTGIAGVYVNIHSAFGFHTYRFDGVEAFIDFVTADVDSTGRASWSPHR
jgi:hypothetical protein